MEHNALIEKLAAQHRLEPEEYQALLLGCTPEDDAHLCQLARQQATAVYGNRIFIRGLIEISNICKNDCLYCGIRRSNANCQRYRLTPAQIISCAREGYDLGFRTFVLQGGEDRWFTDERLCAILGQLKAEFPDCAVTLSLGERNPESYEALRRAGADRYLLRHETATRSHYRALHPPELSFDHRMQCLETLHALGYQTGCGFMVGSPGQTTGHLVQDLLFIQHFQPEMCGIGPFIPHRDTPFAAEPAGTLELTCRLLSIIRLIRPNILLPATTALGTIHPQGREQGILSGANVVMPNLSPADASEKYMLYDNKLRSGAEAAQNLNELRQRTASIGYEVVTDRGDILIDNG